MTRVTSCNVSRARLNTVMEELLTTDLGICNTRRELFGQLFEELIRQEMIACKVSSILTTDIVFRYFDCFVAGERFASAEDPHRAQADPDVLPGALREEHRVRQTAIDI